MAGPVVISQGGERGRKVMQIIFASATLTSAFFSPLLSPRSHQNQESPDQASSRAHREQAQRQRRPHGGSAVVEQQVTIERTGSAKVAVVGNDQVRRGDKHSGTVYNSQLNNSPQSARALNPDGKSFRVRQAVMGISDPIYQSGEKKKEEKKENTQLVAAQNLIGMMASIIPQEATMLGDALKIATNLTDEKARSQLIDGIQNQAVELLTASVLKNADFQRLEKISNSLITITKDVINSESRAVLDILTDEVTNSIDNKLDKTIDWSDFGKDLAKNFVLTGLSLTLLTQLIEGMPGILALVNKLKESDKEKKIPTKYIVGAILFSLACLSTIIPIALSSTPNHVTETPTLVPSNPSETPITFFPDQVSNIAEFISLLASNSPDLSTNSEDPNVDPYLLNLFLNAPDIQKAIVPGFEGKESQIFDVTAEDGTRFQVALTSINLTQNGIETSGSHFYQFIGKDGMVKTYSLMLLNTQTDDKTGEVTRTFATLPSPNTGGEVLGNVIIAVFNNADAKDPHTLLFRMITDLDDGLAVLPLIG